MKIFLICPVRRATDEQKIRIANYVSLLKSAGAEVHYPAVDTDQSDPIGWDICSTNRDAIAYADEVHVYWSTESSGTLFDLGMAFALGKPIVIANPEDVDTVEGRAFENLITYWAWQSDEGEAW